MPWRYIKQEGVGTFHFKRNIREGFTEKVTFKQIPEGDESYELSEQSKFRPECSASTMPGKKYFYFCQSYLHMVIPLTKQTFSF